MTRERLARTLYRLDVDERAASDAIATGTNAPAQLAHLILERSVAKAATRAATNAPPDDEDRALLL